MSAATWQPVAWRSFAWRFVAVALLLGWLAQVCGERVVVWMQPALAAEIAWLDDTYELKALKLDSEGADRVLRLVVSQRRYIHLAGRLFEPNPLGRAHASTLLGHVWLPVVLLVALVLAWPAQSLTQWLWRWPRLVPAVALLTALNVPLVLWAGIWRLHVEAFAPEHWSPLLIWADFMQAGGEHVLALGLALLCLAARPCRQKGQW